MARGIYKRGSLYIGFVIRALTESKKENPRSATNSRKLNPCLLTEDRQLTKGKNPK